MQIQAIHSLDFCFGFIYFFNCGNLLYPKYIIDFFVEIIFESKNTILIFQFFGPKTNLK
jgi:hypothetical protein